MCREGITSNSAVGRIGEGFCYIADIVLRSALEQFVFSFKLSVACGFRMK